LESILLREWGTGRSKKQTDGRFSRDEDDAEENEDYDDADTEDVIEMYNEFGELIGTYTASEYERMRRKK
jgi:hypothetical protein